MTENVVEMFPPVIFAFSSVTSSGLVLYNLLTPSSVRMATFAPSGMAEVDDTTVFLLTGFW